MKRFQKILAQVLAIASIALMFSGCGDSGFTREAAVAQYGEDLVARFDKLQVGDTFVLGEFEQDGDDKNHVEPIEWTVLKRDGDKVLLLSSFVLTGKQFSDSKYDTWSNSTLRTWLNQPFFRSSFSAQEKAMIMPNADGDRVFLLDGDEVQQYVSGSVAKTVPTKAAEYFVQRSDCQWWLRSEGSSIDTVMCVDKNGNTNRIGIDADYGYLDSTIDGYVGHFIGIRPAIWVSAYQITEMAASEISGLDGCERQYKVGLEQLRKGNYPEAYEYFLNAGKDYEEGTNYLLYTKALSMELYDGERLLRMLPVDFENVAELLAFLDANRAWKEHTYYCRELESDIYENTRANINFFYTNKGQLRLYVSLYSVEHYVPQTTYSPYEDISLSTRLENDRVFVDGNATITLRMDSILISNYFGKHDPRTFLAE